MDAETAPLPQVVFRGKKRKAYRQRSEAEDEATPTPQAPTAATSESARGNTPPAPQPSSASPDAAAVRGGEDDASATTATATATAAARNEEEDDEVGLSVAEALRLRNARRSKLGGVKFSANDALSRGAGDAPAEEQQQEGVNDELSLMIREEESRVLERSRTTAAAIADASKRFAPQTGLSGELINKHMRHSPAAATATQRDQSSSSSDNNQQQPSTNTQTTGYHQPGSSSSSKLTATKPLERQPALQGELMEVDLGEEARSRNEAMTERARRRLLGEDVGDDYDGKEGARPTKVRLGRDGKPWRPRNRRGSDAVKRDQIVEEILRENRLDVYDTPTPPPGTTATSTPAAGTGAEASEEGAADDRIAEEFRREFMEAMAQRQQQRRKKQQPPPSSTAKPGAKKDEDVLRGPKLGGSRNARAAMRDLLLKEQEKEKEKGKLGGAGAGGARRGGRR
ncbi:hypothetical protein DL769_001850 [Monosporascus sp. CRB-8-3]|nr:hypothetical protein DL769_001850 [Monosporascus sp. CRB-8-3]